MPLKRTPPKNLCDFGSAVIQHSESEPNIATQCDTPSAEISTTRKRKREEEELLMFRNEFMELFSSWKREQEARFSTILSAMEEIKGQNTEIRNSIDYMSLKYDELLAKIHKLEAEKNANCKQIEVLESKIESMEGSLRSTNIELSNIPKFPKENKENLISIIQEAAKLVGAPIGLTEIRNIYRINTRNENNKPIVVELTSALLREKVLKAVRKYNNEHKSNRLSTSHLHLDCPSRPVFISENLTFQKKKLFFAAREFAKINTFSFCWISQGKIYLRKKEGDPYIRINNESDLANINVE
ncbi:unnamed protein product [Chilo suppressalis]|uniref:FP protein C-terminal domain-containing protein n=1 Tax=Chilo suppressalis TaxID=168631 RepID=A0ABN8AZC0_CHISP|nr:unnamed protein product [Chilo suppressalis]